MLCGGEDAAPSELMVEPGSKAKVVWLQSRSLQPLSGLGHILQGGHTLFTHTAPTPGTSFRGFSRRRSSCTRRGTTLTSSPPAAASAQSFVSSGLIESIKSVLYETQERTGPLLGKLRFKSDDTWVAHGIRRLSPAARGGWKSQIEARMAAFLGGPAPRFTAGAFLLS